MEDSRMKEKECKNCKWIVKIREETLDKDIYYCLHKESRWDRFKDDFGYLDQLRTNSTWSECEKFEERINELNHIPIIRLNYFDVYEELLNTKTKKMNQELKSYKRTFEKIRDAVGIKISNIEKEVNKLGDNKDDIEKLIRSRDWYKNHYSNLNENYNGICNAVWDLGYTIINDGKSGIEKRKDLEKTK